MALIKFGGGITEMRGSMAGNVYSRNKSGAYIRSRTKPINPNTALQQVVRATLAFLTSRWSDTLTIAQRAAWNLYGSNVAMLNKLGESIYLSGFNHYIRCNSILKRSARTLVDAGPVIFEIPEADPTFSITASEATQLVQYTFDDTMAWNIEDNGWMHLFGGQPQNGQRNFFGGPWKLAHALAGAALGGAVSPANSAHPFVIAEGQRIWVYGRITRADGRLSQPFRNNVLVSA